MPATKKSAVKPPATTKNKKLSPAERSQVAKDRWAKRRADKAMEEVVVTVNTMLGQAAVMGVDVSTSSEPTSFIVTTDGPITAGSPPMPSPDVPVIPKNPTPEQPPIAPESITTTNGVTLPSPVAGGEQLNISAYTIEAIVEERVAQALRGMDSQLLGNSPAPQLVTVAPQKKQKKTPVPKEFLVALKTADKRLADAIDEYEECSSRINYLKDAIPRLQRTVLALRNESNPDAPANSNNAFNPVALYNSPQLNPPPFQAYVDPLAAIHGAAAAPPVSRAQGGAIQFSPEVIGSLEGPDDDEDTDKYITGPLAGGGWK